jgi:carbonic anhydrase
MMCSGFGSIRWVPKKIAIYGYVYDVKSGRLLEVPEAKRPAEAAA